MFLLLENLEIYFIRLFSLKPQTKNIFTFKHVITIK